MPAPNQIIPVNHLMRSSKQPPSLAQASLFASAVWRHLRQDSDIDLLVEFEPDQTPSLFTIVIMEDELAALLGRKADLRTAQDLSQYFRDEVITMARPLYVKP